MDTCQLHLNILVSWLPFYQLLATDFHSDLWNGWSSRLIFRNNSHVNLRVMQGTIHVRVCEHTARIPLHTFAGLTSGVTSQVGLESTLNPIAEECRSIIMENLSLCNMWRAFLTACKKKYLQYTVLGKLTGKCKRTHIDMCFKVFGHNKAHHTMLKIVDPGRERHWTTQKPLPSPDNCWYRKVCELNFCVT